MIDIILKILRSYKTNYNKRNWAIFVDGQHVALTKSRVYYSENIAKRKIIDVTVGRYLSKDKREKAYENLESLIRQGIIEIKQI